MPWRMASAGVRSATGWPSIDDAAGIGAIGAGEHARELAAARAEQPADAEHFAGVQA